MRIRALWFLLAFGTGIAGTTSVGVRVLGTDVRRATAVVAHPEVAPDRFLPSLLTLLSTAGLALAVAWLTCSVALCVADALSGPARPAEAARRASSFLRPRAMRLLVGAALGTTVSGLVPAAQAVPVTERAPAVSDVGSSSGQAWTARLDGLPLPDRATGTLAGSTRCAPRAAASPTPATRSWHRVRPGESLWAIAAQRLPADVAPAEVDAAWRDLYAVNRAAVGADPDLLLPGTLLRLPGHLSPDDPGVSR